MKKPWLLERGGRQLEGFLGSRGMRTSEIRTTCELIETAAYVFGLPMQYNCQMMADAVAALPPNKRRELAEKHIGPSPSRQKSAGKKSVALIDRLARELGVTKSSLEGALRSLLNGENV